MVKKAKFRKRKKVNRWKENKEAHLLMLKYWPHILLVFLTVSLEALEILHCSRMCTSNLFMKHLLRCNIGFKFADKVATWHLFKEKLEWISVKYGMWVFTFYESFTNLYFGMKLASKSIPYIWRIENHLQLFFKYWLKL